MNIPMLVFCSISLVAGLVKFLYSGSSLWKKERKLGNEFAGVKTEITPKTIGMQKFAASILITVGLLGIIVGLIVD